MSMDNVKYIPSKVNQEKGRAFSPQGKLNITDDRDFGYLLFRLLTPTPPRKRQQFKILLSSFYVESVFLCSNHMVR